MTEAKRILVVDDDQDIREIIIYILTAEGYDVLGIDNGKGVAIAVQQQRPNMILLDVQLGDTDGRDICRDLKQEPATADIAIMMISASHGWPSLKEKECNADNFLAKPFDVTELIQCVRRYI